ncbi:hypothetical protein niasHT_037948 [Heterodera trifolii]|uniref:Uncharacterized protein n=1 Tax=Heterodera trifolii TaxID=157864 RepID=A0ABD2HVZ1_9BILA
MTNFGVLSPIFVSLCLFHFAVFTLALRKGKTFEADDDVPLNDGEDQRRTVEFRGNLPSGVQSPPMDNAAAAQQMLANFDGVPPGFENFLPVDTLEKMRKLHRNSKMPIRQKQVEFDRLMSAVPSETLAKIPLPPGFETLPESVQSEVRNIHGNSKLNWTQKTEKVHRLIESLPPGDRPIPPPNFSSLAPHPADFFPQNPPPGFEKVIPAPIYKKLLDIHRNPSLGTHEKSRQIDQIMRSLPQNVIDQLPLPPGFDQLPEKELKKARAIFSDRSLSFQEKDRKVFEFVKSLPSHLRRIVRPTLPPMFARLRSDTQAKIGDLLEDESLDDAQRQKRFWQLANGLTEDEKATLGDVLKFAPA